MGSENIEASQAQDAVQGQSDRTEVQSATQDNALQDEKAYAKKMRHRAQAAEEELAKLRQDAKDKEEKALADQGKYKEMYENLKKESTVWKSHSKEYMEFQSSEKSTLLEQLPEEERAVFKDLGLKQLKAVVAKMQPKPSQPKIVHGNVGGDLKLNKSYGDMTEDERRALYEQLSKAK